MLHSSCLMHFPIICFNSPLIAFCWIVFWDVQAFMMTCVLAVGTVRVPTMVYGWVSAGRGRELVSWSSIGGPCQAGRATSQLR